jgi:hypothetical protein
MHDKYMEVVKVFLCKFQAKFQEILGKESGNQECFFYEKTEVKNLVIYSI